MKTFFFWCLVFCTLGYACQPVEPPRDPDDPEQIEHIELDTFSRIPTAFADCGCAFAGSEAGLENRQFLFVNGDKSALMKINGEELLLELESSGESDNWEKKTFAGQGYRVNLFLEKTKNGKEVQHRTPGELEIKTRFSVVKYKGVAVCACL